MNKAIVMLALSQVGCLALAQSAGPANLEPHKVGAS
jgi:hypothetical protein